MAGFKTPTFQDRAALAASAKQKALDKLKAKAPVDEAMMAERRRAWEEEQAALAAERAQKAEALAVQKAERAAAKAERLAVEEAERAEAEAAAALKAQRLRPATPAEMKAARDARYAARKAAQQRR